MLSKKSDGLLIRRKRMSRNITCAICYFLFVACCLVFGARSSYAEIIDRVVAFVDDQAITLSELREEQEDVVKVAPGVTEEEVLNTMVNKRLLLRDAKRYRIEAPTEEEILRDYIDLKVRAFIRISEGQAEEFYQQNTDGFSGKPYDDVRDEIEEYLTEKEVNLRLKELVKELREKAYVKIQVKTE